MAMDECFCCRGTFMSYPCSIAKMLITAEIQLYYTVWFVIITQQYSTFHH